MGLTKKFTLLLGNQAAGPAALNYTDTLISTFGATEVWPLVDIESGTTILAKVDASRNGTLTGWDLQNTASPVAADTLKAPLSSATDFGSIFTTNGSTGLAEIFNPDVGSLAIWFNAPRASIIREFIFESAADGSNYLLARFESGGESSMSILRVANGVSKGISSTLTAYTKGTWALLGISWNVGADKLELSLNGTLITAAITGNAAWTGGTLVNAAIASRGAGAGTQALAGTIAYVALKAGAAWSVADFAAMYNAAASVTVP